MNNRFLSLSPRRPVGAGRRGISARVGSLQAGLRRAEDTRKRREGSRQVKHTTTVPHAPARCSYIYRRLQIGASRKEDREDESWPALLLSKMPTLRYSMRLAARLRVDFLCTVGTSTPNALCTEFILPLTCASVRAQVLICCPFLASRTMQLVVPTSLRHGRSPSALRELAKLVFPLKRLGARRRAIYVDKNRASNVGFPVAACARVLEGGLKLARPYGV